MKCTQTHRCKILAVPTKGKIIPRERVRKFQKFARGQGHRMYKATAGYTTAPKKFVGATKATLQACKSAASVVRALETGVQRYAILIAQIYGGISKKTETNARKRAVYSESSLSNFLRSIRSSPRLMHFCQWCRYCSNTCCSPFFGSLLKFVCTEFIISFRS